jgi:hypothetical protein
MEVRPRGNREREREGLRWGGRGVEQNRGPERTRERAREGQRGPERTSQSIPVGQRVPAKRDGRPGSRGLARINHAFWRSSFLNNKTRQLKLNNFSLQARRPGEDPDRQSCEQRVQRPKTPKHQNTQKDKSIELSSASIALLHWPPAALPIPIPISPPPDYQLPLTGRRLSTRFSSSTSVNLSTIILPSCSSVSSIIYPPTSPPSLSHSLCQLPTDPPY